MIMVFFDSWELIYMLIVPRGAAIITTYTIKALCKFMEHFKKKRPTMAQQQWRLQWDNASVHTATSVKEWMAVKGIQVREHTAYLPDLAPAYFFLFRRVMEALAGTTLDLDQESLKKAWKGVIRTITIKDFAIPSGDGLSRPKRVFGPAATSLKNLEK
jgi:hypothetical protein